MKTQLSGVWRLDNHSSLDRPDSHHMQSSSLCSDDFSLKFTLGPDIYYFIDCFLAVIEQIEHGKVIEPASGELSKVHLSPDI